ncbi:MAG: hypothetical protein FWG18_02715 [Alphaproteobacteria bacterium]|nr:hypothetical protein [Alphaproteobacteria bacterium]
MEANKTVLIAVPTFENIAPDTFKSVYGLQRPLNTQISFDFMRGYDCARARCEIARAALAGGYDYVFMVDSDIILPPNALVELIAADKDIIMGWYPSKRAPEQSELFHINESGNFQLDNVVSIASMPPNQVIEIMGGGAGCMLIKTDILRQFGDNRWFRFVEYPGGGVLSEDLYFCTTARAAGFKIFAHTGIRCGHISKVVL